ERRTPVQYKGQTLLSLDRYAEELRRKEEELAQTQKLIQDALAAQQVESDRLNGVPGKSKGLRELLEEQRVAFNASNEEQYLLVQPAALQLDYLRRLQHRLKMIQERQAELGGK